MRTQEELAKSIVPPGAGADFIARASSGLVMLTPVSEQGQMWLSSNVSADATWAGSALVLELQFFPVLADAILDAGFRFEHAV